MSSMKFKRGLANAIVYLILIVMSIFWVAPILWIVLQSFGGEGIAIRAKLIPSTFTFDNYLYLNFYMGNRRKFVDIHTPFLVLTKFYFHNY